MPVVRLHGCLQAVIVWNAGSPSLSVNVSGVPCLTIGGAPSGPEMLRSPWLYWKLSIVTAESAPKTGPSGRASGSGRPALSPPWLSFSGRWPWVIWPGQSTLFTNGSGPPDWSAYQTSMIPIDSYHDDLSES